MPRSRSRWRTRRNNKERITKNESARASSLFVICSSLSCSAAAQSFPKADRPRQRLRQRDRSGHRGRDRSPARSARTADLLRNRRRDGLVAQRHVGRRNTPTGCSRSGASDRRSRTTACSCSSRRTIARCASRSATASKACCPTASPARSFATTSRRASRTSDYSGGIRNGVDHLVEIVEKHQVLTPEELAKFNESTRRRRADLRSSIPFFGLFVTIGFGMLGIGLRIEDRISGAVRQSLRRHAAAHEPGVHVQGVAVHAGAVGAGDVRHRAIDLAAGRRGAMRSAIRAARAAADRRRAAGRWDRRVRAVRAVQVSSSGSSSSFGGGSSGGGGAAGRW